MARRSSITDEQKAAIVAEVKAGASVAEVAKKHKVSVPSVYIYVRRPKKSSKKKVANNGAKQKVVKRGRRSASADTVDLSSMMEDIVLARRFRELLDDLGYVKR
jgi:transposase